MTINAASFSEARFATCAASKMRETCWITFRGLAIVAVGSLIARPICFSPWSTARILINSIFRTTEPRKHEENYISVPPWLAGFSLRDYRDAEGHDRQPGPPRRRKMYLGRLL